MLKRLILVALLLTAAIPADAVEYTDIYFDKDEPGWGFFLAQSNTFQALGFFVYGPDGKPTWYTAQLNLDTATGIYSGQLFATTGTYFANPWQGGTNTPAGTASFQPIDIYHAVLTYTVTGLAPVIKPVQRFTLTPYVFSGNYSGSMAGSISGCTDPAANDSAFRGRYSLAVAQVADQSATLTFTFVDTTHNGIVCTVSGPLTHLGRLYQLTNGQASCTGPGLNTGPQSATIDSLHPTGQGIEGRWSGSLGEGCVASLRFAAVLNVNN